MCREHKLAVMGNSDMHEVISETYFGPDYPRRPVTLVIARERTPESIREALFAGRTAVWYGNHLAGFEEYVMPIFKAAVKAGSPFKDDGKNIWFELINSSDLPMELTGGPEGAPASISLPALSMFVVKASRKFLAEPLVYDVSNIVTGSNSVLRVEIRPAK
jgi:hypothetical protein